MKCQHQKKTLKWPIAFISYSKPFDKMSKGHTYGRGIAEVEGELCLVFHKWCGVQTEQNVPQMIEKYRDDVAQLIKLTFDFTTTIHQFNQFGFNTSTNIKADAFPIGPNNLNC